MFFGKCLRAGGKRTQQYRPKIESVNQLAGISLTGAKSRDDQ
jgi:hypothetical protein